MNYKSALNIFLILAIAYMLIVRIMLIFSYSIDLDGVEFVFVRQMQVIIDGKELYPNFAEFPYSSCLYAPVYLYFTKAVVSLFDKSLQENLHFLFVVGRSISFAAFLTQIGLLIAYLRKRFFVSWFAILLLLFFYLILITGHMYAVRPDALKFLFFTISLFALIEYEFFNPKIIYLFVSLLFAVLNVYLKQDTLIYQSIIIGVLFLLTKKRKYIALLFAFWIAAAAMYGLFLLIFGRYFFDNTVLLNFQKVKDVQRSPNVVFLLFSALRVAPFLILLEYYRRKKIIQFQNGSPLQYMYWIALALFVVSHIFILRAGSYINYAYEDIFVVLFVVGASLSLVFPNFESLRPLRFLVLPFVAFLIAGNWLIHSYTYNFTKERELKKIFFQNEETARQLKQIIQNDTVFFPNAEKVIFNKNLNLIYGYDYHLGRFISLIILKDKMGTVDTELTFYDSKKYDDCFENGTVKYIVNETDKDDYIKKYYYPKYQPYKTVGNLTVYRFQ